MNRTMEQKTLFTLDNKQTRMVCAIDALETCCDQMNNMDVQTLFITVSQSQNLWEYYNRRKLNDVLLNRICQLKNKLIDHLITRCE